MLSAGLLPEFPGIYQLNVTAPDPATDRLYLRSGGWQSNIVDVGIRSGTNTANVRGTIDALYPSSDPLPRPCIGEDDAGPCGSGFDGFSAALHAGSFSVSFDIVPSAKSFSVAAVGEAGGSIISVDPAGGAYTASITTITPAVASGDFSNSAESLWDYSSCGAQSAVCLPFPGNRVPPSRISPSWVKTTQLLPTPNTTGTVNLTAVQQASGNLSGSRLIIDGENNSTLSRFGGLVWVPYGPFAKRVSTFKLYVDGRLVALKDFPYSVPVVRSAAP